VWKLDRLGRSLRDLITMLDDLKQRGVKFRSLTEAIDTETPTGRAMWQMIGVLAELERSLISKRTRAGVKAARGRGVKFGRKPKLTPQQITHAQKADRGRAAPRGRGRSVQGQPQHPVPGACRNRLNPTKIRRSFMGAKEFDSMLRKLIPATVNVFKKLEV
jgi:Resolvase, N terminal domain